MEVYIPFDAVEPKRRLEPLLSASERRSLARAMLADVVRAVSRAGRDPTVVATGPVEVAAAVEVDERRLSPAVDDRIARSDDRVAVVMADLPLLTDDVVRELLSTAGDVVLAPGLGGGTNALVTRSADFRTDYHGCSIRDHRDRARAAGLEVATVDSYRLGIDVDEPADLVEVALHADGRSADWLADRGFHLETDRTGRVTIGRGAEG